MKMSDFWPKSKATVGEWSLIGGEVIVTDDECGWRSGVMKEIVVKKVGNSLEVLPKNELSSVNVDKNAVKWG